jgi:hypothetical protein
MDMKWHVWKESVIIYFHSKIDQILITLAYIIREKDVPPPEAIYHTVHEQLVNKAILYGAESNTNNSAVYDLLQYDPEWSCIGTYQQNRDGRGAWKALVAYYKGNGMQTRSKQECYDAISKATYQGVKRNFDFSTCHNPSTSTTRPYAFGRTYP